VGDGASDVNSGHGTHVAGSVLGNGDVSDGIAGCDYNNSYAGIAPEATLVFQALENNGSGALSGIPSDLNILFNQAQGAGATIHTNSWGSSQAGAYTSFSEDVDQFVWNNKDFLILFSAGNDGMDADGNGVIDPISMGSPATAKNCITVGASENDRDSLSTPTPGANIDWGTGWPFDYPIDPINSDHVSDDATGMAAFSSRGPCLDGRIKPDIVAPGTNVISTKSSLATDLWSTGGLGGGLENSYIFSGGTSMSTPLVAGAATLVREFYTTVEGLTAPSPSAALIKATLLNGAFDMSPGQYGTGSTQEIPDPPRPNNVEGWGRADLETSIFPTAPKTLRYADITASLNTGESRIYNFDVTDLSVPLKATLVWSDYPGSTVAGGGLVNDLDLILIDPSSNRQYPNNASQRGQAAVIAYDDGGATGLYIWTAGNRVGVRFTPTAYPAKLDKGIFLLDSASYPNTFNYYVYDGSDGTGPQNILASGTTTIRGGGWHVVDLSSFDLTVTSGDFFVAIGLNNNLLWYYDSTSPNGRSWDYAGGNWSKNPSDDYMFRAVVTSSDYSTPSDRVNNAVGIDIPSPAFGSYSIRVEGYNVPQGPQPYALVVTGGTLSALTEVTPPVAPSSPSASFAPVAQIDLSWTDNSNNESGFRIERKIGAAGSYSPRATVGPNVTNYNDAGLTEATTYYYRMTAYNAQGDSMYSSEVNATTLPAAPSGLSATAASSSMIDLAWTDNSGGETGYKIMRKIGAGGTYSQVGTVGANVTSYSNTGLSGSKTYYYHVMAYNVTGDSAQSNEANATTPATPKLASGGGGSGGCFITTAGFDSHLGSSADFIGEHESANARKISLGLVLLATLCFVIFRRKYRR
jgi:subtilisin family serine protease